MKTKKEIKKNSKPIPHALSVKQPWAWFIVNGYKDIENRRKVIPEKFLGKRIFIQAGQTYMDNEDYSEFLETCKEMKIKKYPRSKNDFDYGYIIGSVIVTDVIANSESEWAQEGARHWVLKGAKPMKPIKQKGQLGIFSVKL